MKLIVDTREQKPLWTPPCSEIKEIQRKKLDVGDYTTDKLLNRVHAERKSPGDLYGSIIQGHKRFKIMLNRAVEKSIILNVFVECPKEVFINKRWNPRAKRLLAKPEVLDRILTTISSRYYVNFVWCLDRDDMRDKMLRWLEDYENDQE